MQRDVTQTLVNGLKAIANMNELNRDLADAKVMARRTLRDAKLEEKKEDGPSDRA